MLGGQRRLVHPRGLTQSSGRVHVSNHPHPNEPQLFHPLWLFLVLVSHLTWTKLYPSLHTTESNVSMGRCLHGFSSLWHQPTK